MSGPPELSREIPGAGADADGAVPPRVGGDRGARPRPGRGGPPTSGAPAPPLRWTAKSTRTLARTLQTMGHRLSHQLVRELLTAAGYSLQANRKTREGPPHPDRD